MKKKIVIFALILLALFSIASVCAGEVNDTLTASEDDSQLELTATEDNLNGIDETQVIGEPSVGDNGTFTALQEKIGNAGSNSTIVLPNNYLHENEFTVDGILINKSLTIDGNGFTIDANNSARIFNIVGATVTLQNIKFVNGHVNGFGAAVYCKDGNLTIINCTFLDNHAFGSNSSGGAVYFNGGKLTLNNSKFDMNTAELDGGALYFKGEDGIISKSNFTSNRAFYNGAVYMNSIGGNVIGCLFADNVATDSAGALGWVKKQNGGISNSQFINNSAPFGGAIYINDGNNFTLAHSKFIENNATKGGAIYWTGGYGLISESLFDKNSASNDGGAVFFNGTNGMISGSNFTNNKAYYNGAVYMNSIEGTVDDCIFANNVATNSSGALGWVKKENGTISYSIFINNSAPLGGAVYVNEGNNFAIKYSEFIKNNATRGGAVYWTGGDGLILDSSFESNFASDDAGAVYFKGDDGIIMDSNFTNNRAFYNGAVYMNSVQGTVLGCLFADNVATDSAGALGWVKKENGTIVKSNFINNTAPRGGAIYLNNGTNFVIAFSNFENNTASLNGGAVFWDSGNDGEIIESSFINNTATNNGGAIFWNNTLNGNITGSKFIGNDAFDGGAIYFRGSNGIINQSRFINNTAYYNGAVYMNSVQGTVDDCVFVNNVATNSSGALGWVKKENGTITNSRFIKNSAPLGGAIYVNEGNNFAVVGSKFIKNNATRGGAIYWTGVDGSIVESSFDMNSAVEDGGAVYFKGSYGVIGFSNFTNNRAYYNGAVYMNSVEGIIDGCIFANNAATDSAGALGWVKKDNGTIYSSQFINNTAPRGGAIYLNNGTNFYIVTSEFINNTASLNGGAVFWDSGNDGNIIGSSFINNNATLNGGAVFWNNTLNGNITGSKFIDNDAFDGGAIYFRGSNGIINGSEFINNTAYYNGAVYMNSIDGTVDNCIFANNVATNSSGALGWVKKQNGTICNSQFINNRAPLGGAIYVNEGNNLSVADSKFIENEAIIGGAIYWTGGDGMIYNSSFDSNFASQDAGAVYFKGNGGLIWNSNFTNNMAHYNGAVYMNSVAGSVVDCIFANNVATDSAGALGWVKKENGTIRGSKFINNTAPLGGAIYLNNGTEFYISLSKFVNNTASKNGGAIYWDSGNEGIIISTSFINNNATGNGGAVYFDGIDGKIGYSKFINNTAASGGAIYNAGSMDAVGNQFTNNTAADGKNDIAGNGSVKYGISFEIDAEDNVYGKTAKININVTSNGKPVNGGNISTVVNNVTYSDNVVNGVATLLIPNLNAGSYDLDIEYVTNDSSYLNSSDFYILDIDKVNATFKIDVYDNVYGKTAKINVTVTNNGQPVNQGNVSTVVNNVTYSANVVNGVATLQIPNLNAGSYDISIAYATDDSNYNNRTELYALVINKQNIVITAKDASYIINYGGKYSITLKDSNGNVVVGEKVTFKLNGKSVGSAVTNAKGVATISLTAKALKSAKAGKKNMVITLTSDNYSATAKTVKITIKKEKTKIAAKNKKFKKSKKTKKYTITLKNSKGKGVKKVKVTLKVKGKTYKAKTNAKGKATFKIKKLTKKGKHKATIKFKGNAYYIKSSKKVKITIK